MIAGGGETKRAEIIDVLLAAGDQDRGSAARYQFGQPPKLYGRELAGLGPGPARLDADPAVPKGTAHIGQPPHH